MDNQLIQNMDIVRFLGQGMALWLHTTATMAISCMEDIIHENVYPMDTGLDMHHDVER